MKTMFILITMTIIHPSEVVIVSEDTVQFDQLEDCKAAASHLKTDVEKRLSEQKGYDMEVITDCVSYLKKTDKN